VSRRSKRRKSSEKKDRRSVQNIADQIELVYEILQNWAEEPLGCSALKCCPATASLSQRCYLERIAGRLEDRGGQRGEYSKKWFKCGGLEQLSWASFEAPWLAHGRLVEHLSQLIEGKSFAREGKLSREETDLLDQAQATVSKLKQISEATKDIAEFMNVTPELVFLGPIDNLVIPVCAKISSTLEVNARQAPRLLNGVALSGWLPGDTIKKLIAVDWEPENERFDLNYEIITLATVINEAARL
jgi:hypothetical protein